MTWGEYANSTYTEHRWNSFLGDFHCLVIFVPYLITAGHGLPPFPSIILAMTMNVYRHTVFAGQLQEINTQQLQEIQRFEETCSRAQRFQQELEELKKQMGRQAVSLAEKDQFIKKLEVSPLQLDIFRQPVVFILGVMDTKLQQNKQIKWEKAEVTVFYSPSESAD